MPGIHVRYEGVPGGSKHVFYPDNVHHEHYCKHNQYMPNRERTNMMPITTTYGEMLDEKTISLLGPVPFKKGKLKVIITPDFRATKGNRHFGMFNGRILIHPQFYDPIDDFQDYM